MPPDMAAECAAEIRAAEERENARYLLIVTHKVTGFGRVFYLTPEVVTSNLAPILGGTRRAVNFIRIMAESGTYAFDNHHDVNLIDRDAIDVEQFDVAGAKERVERLMEAEGLVQKDEEQKVAEPQVVEPQVVEAIVAPMVVEPQVVEAIVAPMVEEPQVVEAIVAPMVEEAIVAPMVEEPKVEAANPEPQVEEAIVAPRTRIDLEPLLSLPAAEAPDGDQMLEALLQFDVDTAVDYIREFGAEHLLLSPVLWSALAPGQHCSQKPPAWFPGTKAQYMAYKRARSGHKTHCVLATALADYMSGQAARDEALELQFAAQTAQHEQTRSHIDQSLDRRFGATDVEDGDSLATITSKFQVRRAALKHEEQAARFLVKEKEVEEKKRRRADSRGSRSSKSSKA